MATVTPILLLHVCGAMIGVISGFAAMFFCKGSVRRDGKAGAFDAATIFRVVRVSRFRRLPAAVRA